jgi:chromosome segregation ATPase
MDPKPNTPDQADVLAQFEQVKTDLATAKQTIGTLQGQVTSLEAEKATLTTTASEATTKAATLETNLSTATTERDALKAENATLQASMTDFNARVAAEIAKHGIRPAAIAQKPEEGRKLTLTEQCLANRK